ncbi:hypothetical protein BJF79_28725 [Actinomadura sp. CNU-125]|nr:hypothetical protein BJF79_28725 [Actinomadura sp. CNU-125]
MVAARVRVRDPAVQPGERLPQDGRAGGRVRPGGAREPVAGFAAGEPVPDVRLVLAEELTAKTPLRSISACVWMSLARQTMTSGGSRLTLPNEPAVMPCRPPSAVVVTTATPVGHCASTVRKVCASTVTASLPFVSLQETLYRSR